MSIGVELISQEREDQLSKYAIANDAVGGHLIFFARYLLMEDYDAEKWNFEEVLIEEYGLSKNYLTKVNNKPHTEKLAIAGALIAAEIDVIKYLNEIEDEDI